MLRRIFSGAALVCAFLFLPQAYGASCTTQAQMTAAQRDPLVNAARTILGEVQSSDLQGLRANTLPAIAADFNGIEQTVNYLHPLIQSATVTVDEVYLLDASMDPSSASTDFYCGSPVVGFNFNNLPQGTYAVAILHATGVPQPQQVALILAQAPGNKWQLAGFFEKPMVLNGHDGVWYWQNARKFAKENANWGAYFYYHLATYLLDPVNFLASQNLEKLRNETSQVHADLPANNTPITINAHGTTFHVTAVDTTTALGPLDLDVHYAPDPAQVAELRSPPVARQQVVTLMAGILAQHPELQNAFHGMWLHADQGGASLFALELPMSAGEAGNPQAASGTAHP
ncbi:MAG: hypothetical protein ACLGSH_08935 [Acidobacteriota bacterium]